MLCFLFFANDCCLIDVVSFWLLVVIMIIFPTCEKLSFGGASIVGVLQVSFITSGKVLLFFVFLFVVFCCFFLFLPLFCLGGFIVCQEMV